VLALNPENGSNLVVNRVIYATDLSVEKLDLQLNVVTTKFVQTVVHSMAAIRLGDGLTLLFQGSVYYQMD
jgi:hypothetical protein